MYYRQNNKGSLHQNSQAHGRERNPEARGEQKKKKTKEPTARAKQTKEQLMFVANASALKKQQPGQTGYKKNYKTDDEQKATNHQL